MNLTKSISKTNPELTQTGTLDFPSKSIPVFLSKPKKIDKSSSQIHFQDLRMNATQFEIETQSAPELTQRDTLDFPSKSIPEFLSKSKKIAKSSSQNHFQDPKMNATQFELDAAEQTGLPQTGTLGFLSGSTPEKKQAKKSKKKPAPVFLSVDDDDDKEYTEIHFQDPKMNATQIEIDDDIIVRPIKPKTKSKRKCQPLPLDEDFGVAMPSPEVSNDVQYLDIFETDDIREQFGDVDEEEDFIAVNQEISILPPRDEIPDIGDFDADDEEIEEIRRQRDEWDRKLAEKQSKKEKEAKEKQIANLREKQIDAIKKETDRLQSVLKYHQDIVIAHQHMIDEQLERLRQAENGELDEALFEKFTTVRRNTEANIKSAKASQGKPSQGKRKPPTKIERRSSVLFDDGDVFRHLATKNKKILSVAWCKYDKNRDEFRLSFISGSTNEDGWSEAEVADMIYVDDFEQEEDNYFKNLNQFIVYHNKANVPEKVQKETAWAGSVCLAKFQDGRTYFEDVGKIKPKA